MARKKEQLNQAVINPKSWVIEHYIQIAIFNLIVILLVLLKSAGYFAPYFLISINITVFVSIIMGVILLGLKSPGVFIIAITFWLFSLFLSFVGLNVWAERSGIYTFEALVVGIFLLIGEKVDYYNYLLKLFQKIKNLFSISK